MVPMMETRRCDEPAEWSETDPHIAVKKEGMPLEDDEKNRQRGIGKTQRKGGDQRGDLLQLAQEVWRADAVRG